MSNVLIRNVPKSLLDQLRQRAAANRRSLQQELLSILEEAARIQTLGPVEVAARIRGQLEASGRKFSDSAEMVREDRER